jgi:heme-degrading monooxygenase HmoA
MITATFIFDIKQFDEAFHALDARIAAAARETSGYIGEDAWEDPKTGRVANVYYWEDETGLKQLISHPDHIEAKRIYSQWLGGYQVMISQVLRTYGDGQLSRSIAATGPA